jgi:hypothetical protein
MSIGNYSELQSAITDFMARTDVSGKATDFIALGEARLNRLLGVVGTTAALTGVIGSDEIDISALSVQEPQNLYVTYGTSELCLTPRALGTYSTTTIRGLPSIWAIEAQKIKLDRPLEEANSFRFVYLGRFALSVAAPTNEFLTNHPDLYLAASIVWGCTYTKDPAISLWKSALDEFVAEVSAENSRKKRSVLTTDPALGTIGRTRYSINVDGNP